MQLQKAKFKDALPGNDGWLPIHGYPYDVHWRGIVRNSYTKENLRPGMTKQGYVTVALSGKSFSVHRLNAISHLENIYNKKVVNHKDGIKNNNHKSNLEWSTTGENNSHAIRTGLKDPIIKARGIIQYDINGNEVARYRTSEDAAGFLSGCICLCCNGKRKMHKGYKWSFIN